MPRRAKRRDPVTLDAQIARLHARLEDVIAHMEQETAARVRAETEIRALLAALARDDGHHRRSLYALRESAGYEPAYTEPHPLVTVAITTIGRRLELLMQRALPSVLAQTHGHLDILVVGDAAGTPTREAIAGLRDDRIRFIDLTHRVVHPDPERHWLAGATLSRNEAYQQARGRWIADLDDDDALRPTAIAQLLELAHGRRLEVAYGIKERHDPSGDGLLLGSFPPQPTEPDWRERGLAFQPWEGAASCGALVHAGLRLFAREYVAADLGQPGDFFRLERMVRAGVRFGMLDEVVYDYYPSRLWPAPS